jgi:transposase InsO family protein
MSPKKKKGPGQTTPVGSSKGAGRKRQPPPKAYPLELRRKAVRLHLEEGLPIKLIGEELKVNLESVRNWVKRYQEQGEAGLEKRPNYPGSRKAQLHPAVHEAIVAVKKENPTFGVRRIADWMQRTLFLRASPETVRQTLHQQEIPLAKPKKKRKKNPQKPRFFERATPNQMWQSDIFCFKLNNTNAYLIGFIDDHSRYIVGLGLYRGQTTENVLEVYRRAVGEYGAPKEMLTDNGRQYAAWQGKTHFQAALARDRVHHIRSAPHHPMTCGKIERFWKTIWDEFLERARFETFESAVERIAYWVQYYNHKRPHQGLKGGKGLVPADRYFNVQKEMRQVIEKGIAQNVEQMALRGKPQTPFYMVGRVGGQNVVLQSDRGQVKITVDGKETGGQNNEQQQRENTQGTDHQECTGEVPGGAGDLDGAAAAGGDLQGTGDPGQPALVLAGKGHGGYAAGTGTAHPQAGRPGADAGPADGEAAGPEDGAVGEPDRTPGNTPGASGSGETGGMSVMPSQGDGDETHTHAAGGDHCAGPVGDADSHGGGQPSGDLPQHLLPEGVEGAGRHDRGPATGPAGTPDDHSDPGGDGDHRRAGPVEDRMLRLGTAAAHPSGNGGS